MQIIICQWLGNIMLDSLTKYYIYLMESRRVKVKIYYVGMHHRYRTLLSFEFPISISVSIEVAISKIIFSQKIIDK